MAVGPGFTEDELLDAVRALHEEGRDEVTPQMALERISSLEYVAASKSSDVDHPFATACHVFRKAGCEGTLPCRWRRRRGEGRLVVGPGSRPHQ